MKKVAIMQPYFLPYIGYWQLINAVDEFIIYDNIEFTKKGWFNRNRILDQDHDRLFTIPVKKDSDFLPVNERYVAEDADKEIERTLRIIQATYKKAPSFAAVYPIIESCFRSSEKNLYSYIRNSINIVTKALAINTPITVSSSVAINHKLKGADKVIALCKATQADIYINAIGGQELYDKDVFAAEGIQLKFIKAKPIEYAQLRNEFVPWLSIVDVMMFNDLESVQQILQEYKLL